MSILRNKLKDRFVQVPNALVTDTSVSTTARLVYVYLASKPDGWVVRNCDVKKAIGIKDDVTIAKVWKELISAGWLTRRKALPGANAGTYEYELWETPKLGENPNMENSQIWEKSIFGKNPDYNNTDSLNNTEEELNNTDINTAKQIKSTLKSRINALFNRRSNTTWSDSELKRLDQIARRNGVLDECTEIESLYKSDYPYRRRDIMTFLNNWSTELDRARNWTGDNQRNNGYYKFDGNNPAPVSDEEREAFNGF